MLIFQRFQRFLYNLFYNQLQAICIILVLKRIQKQNIPYNIDQLQILQRSINNSIARLIIKTLSNIRLTSFFKHPLYKIKMLNRQQMYGQSSNLQLSPIQSSLNFLFNNVKQQLQQNNLIQSPTQLQNIFSSSQKNQYQDSYYVSNLSNIINYLIAMIIQEREHNQSLLVQLTQNVEQNDKRILNGLEIFVDLTQRMADFSKDIFKQRSQQKSLPVQICKHFRQVYQLTQELSTIFNGYIIDNQQLSSQREQLIAMQIKCMQDVFMDQQNDRRDMIQIRRGQSQRLNGIPQQTQEYIISLRQQISHLHQTLLKNDQQFTMQIQNYNKTLREMSSAIKAYQLQFAKITNYQMRIQQLQKMIVRFRQEKYRNQIVIQNMAKKIRNFQKQIKGDRAFLSPHRQRLVSSPDSKFSMLNSKVTSALSVVNSVNNSNNNLLSPTRKSFY